MHVPLIFPPFRRRTKCPRCGLLFYKKETQCPHCSQLSDQEVVQLQAKMLEQQKGNENLGKLFLYLALLIGLLILIVLL